MGLERLGNATIQNLTISLLYWLISVGFTALMSLGWQKMGVFTVVSEIPKGYIASDNGHFAYENTSIDSISSFRIKYCNPAKWSPTDKLLLD